MLHFLVAAALDSVSPGGPRFAVSLELCAALIYFLGPIASNWYGVYSKELAEERRHMSKPNVSRGDVVIRCKVLFTSLPLTLPYTNLRTSRSKRLTDSTTSGHPKLHWFHSLRLQ